MCPKVYMINSSSLNTFNNENNHNIIKKLKEPSEKNYLQRKKKRSENKISKQFENHYQKREKIEKNIFHLEKSQNKNQAKIYQFFENKNVNIISSDSNLNYVNNINQRKFTLSGNNKNNSRSNSKNKNKKVVNPFQKFSDMLKEKRVEERFDNFIEKGIFNESEISRARNIAKEYKKEISECFLQENDKLIKIVNFFLNKGFSEKIRYIIYKCLINYGIPNVNNFNKFFENVKYELNQKKLNVPEKMCLLLYIEYINNFIKNDCSSNSLAKNKYISEFFFNKENCKIVQSNLNFIYSIKISTDMENFLQIYLDTNSDHIFQKADIKLNRTFPKSNAVLCRILCNIIYKCDQIGYLNYKKIIANDDIVFDGLKIMGNTNRFNKLEQMISYKLFGKVLSVAKFREVIQNYLLILMSNFHA